MSEQSRHGPLVGIRVLDLTRILSGPYCTLLLADLGAEIVKIEKCGAGDDTRSWGPPFVDKEEAVSTYFASLNRGKRSLALNLRHQASRDILARLVAQSDVVIENFRPGVAQRLGLTHTALTTHNPAIVSCSISGYGRSDAYGTYPGTEIVVEGMSGLMSVTGPRDGEPVRFGIAMVDIATGLTAATRIVGALMEAQSTGRGSHVEVSLYGTALAALGTLITSYSASRQVPTRWGSYHPSIVPYGAFPTADGDLITGVVNDSMWPLFCECLGLGDLGTRPDLKVNAGRVAARDEVESGVSEALRQRPTAVWLDELRTRGLLAAPVRTVAEAVDDPYTRSLDLFVPLADYSGVVSPRLDGVPGDSEPQVVPSLGQHSAAILKELGLNAEQIHNLVAMGAVQVSQPFEAADAPANIGDG